MSPASNANDSRQRIGSPFRSAPLESSRGFPQENVMEQRPHVFTPRAAIKLLKISTLATAAMLLTTWHRAVTQNSLGSGAEVPAFAPGMIQHMQKMRLFKDPDRGAQATPDMISRSEVDRDATGAIATFQPG